MSRPTGVLDDQDEDPIPGSTPDDYLPQEPEEESPDRRQEEDYVASAPPARPKLDPIDAEGNIKRIKRFNAQQAAHQAREEQKKRKAEADRVARDTGAKFYTDPQTGERVADVDPKTGRQRYIQNAPVQYDEKTGRPVKMSPTGKAVDPDAYAPIVENPDDPNDPYIYRKSTHSPWEAIDPEEAVVSEKPHLARSAAKILHSREIRSIDQRKQEIALQKRQPGRLLSSPLSPEKAQELAASREAYTTPEPEPVAKPGFFGGINAEAASRAKAEWIEREAMRTQTLAGIDAQLSEHEELAALEAEAFELDNKKIHLERGGPAAILGQRRQARKESLAEMPEDEAREEITARSESITTAAQEIEARQADIAARAEAIHAEATTGVSAPRAAELRNQLAFLQLEEEENHARAEEINALVQDTNQGIQQRQKRDTAIAENRQRMTRSRLAEDPKTAPFAKELESLDESMRLRRAIAERNPEGPVREAALAALEEDRSKKATDIARRTMEAMAEDVAQIIDKHAGPGQRIGHKSQIAAIEADESFSAGVREAASVALRETAIDRFIHSHNLAENRGSMVPRNYGIDGRLDKDSPADRKRAWEALEVNPGLIQATWDNFDRTMSLGLSRLFGVGGSLAKFAQHGMGLSPDGATAAVGDFLRGQSETSKHLREIERDPRLETDTALERWIMPGIAEVAPNMAGVALNFVPVAGPALAVAFNFGQLLDEALSETEGDPEMDERQRMAAATVYAITAMPFETVADYITGGLLTTRMIPARKKAQAAKNGAAFLGKIRAIEELWDKLPGPIKRAAELGIAGMSEGATETAQDKILEAVVGFAKGKEIQEAIMAAFEDNRAVRDTFITASITGAFMRGGFNVAQTLGRKASGEHTAEAVAAQLRGLTSGFPPARAMEMAEKTGAEFDVDTYAQLTEESDALNERLEGINPKDATSRERIASDIARVEEQRLQMLSPFVGDIYSRLRQTGRSSPPPLLPEESAAALAEIEANADPAALPAMQAAMRLLAGTPMDALSDTEQSQLKPFVTKVEGQTVLHSEILEQMAEASPAFAALVSRGTIRTEDQRREEILLSDETKTQTETQTPIGESGIPSDAQADSSGQAGRDGQPPRIPHRSVIAVVNGMEVAVTATPDPDGKGWRLSYESVTALISGVTHEKTTDDFIYADSPQEIFEIGLAKIAGAFETRAKSMETASEKLAARGKPGDAQESQKMQAAAAQNRALIERLRKPPVTPMSPVMETQNQPGASVAPLPENPVLPIGKAGRLATERENSAAAQIVSRLKEKGVSPQAAAKFARYYVRREGSPTDNKEGFAEAAVREFDYAGGFENPAAVVASIDASDTSQEALIAQAWEKLKKTLGKRFDELSEKDRESFHWVYLNRIGPELLHVAEAINKTTVFKESNSGGGVGVTADGEMQIYIADVLAEQSLSLYLEGKYANFVIGEETGHILGASALAEARAKRTGKKIVNPWAEGLAEAGEIFQLLPRKIQKHVKKIYVGATPESHGMEFFRMLFQRDIAFEGNALVDAKGNVIWATEQMHHSPFVNRIQKALQSMLKFFSEMRSALPKDLADRIEEPRQRTLELYREVKKLADQRLSQAYRQEYDSATKPDAKRSGSATRADRPALGDNVPPDRRRQNEETAAEDNSGNRAQRGPSRSGTPDVVARPAAPLTDAERKRLAQLEQKEAEARSSAAYRQEKLQNAALKRAEKIADWEATVAELPEEVRDQAREVLSTAVPGKASYVILSNNRRAPAQYVAMPIDAVEASHTGDQFVANPRHVGNTRDYRSNKAEQRKVRDGSSPGSLNPDILTSDSVIVDAGPPGFVLAVHPTLTTQDGKPLVVAILVQGNGRQQMINLSPAEDRDALTNAWDQKKEQFEIQEVPSGFAGYRFYGAMDLRKDMDKFNRLVADLNPATGVEPNVTELAQIDSAKVPPSDVEGIEIAINQTRAQEVLSKLLREGHGIDKNRVEPLTTDAPSSQAYMRRLLLGIAFQNKAISDIYDNEKLSGNQTFAALIERVAGFAISMRARDHGHVADLLGQFVADVAENLKKSETGNFRHAITRSAEQGQDERLGGRHPVVLEFAAAIANLVETDTSKAGKTIVRHGKTIEAFDKFFANLMLATKERLGTQQDDLLMAPASPESLLRDAIAAHARQNMVVKARPPHGTNTRAKRISQLHNKRRDESLSRWEAEELTQLERLEGQAFLEFFDEVRDDRFQLESLSPAPVITRALSDQGFFNFENGTVVSPDAVMTRRAFHGTPHDWAPETRYRLPDGSTRWIVDGQEPVPEGAVAIERAPAGRARADKVSTGEGAAAFGWGVLYGAEAEEVAERYAQFLSRWRIDQKALGGMSPVEIQLRISVGDTEALALSYVSALKAGETVFDAEKALQRAIGDLPENSKQKYKAALKWLQENRDRLDKASNLYTIEIDVETDQLLDWDLPLSEQSEKVKAAIGTSLPNGERLTENLLGSQIYNAFSEAVAPPVQDSGWSTISNVMMRNGMNVSGQAHASARLLAAGIPGIRYLDQGSRGIGATGGALSVQEDAAGKGWVIVRQGQYFHSGPYSTQEEANRELAKEQGWQTSNYVIFDEALIRVVEKNGEPVGTMAKISPAPADQMVVQSNRPPESPSRKIAEEFSPNWKPFAPSGFLSSEQREVERDFYEQITTEPHLAEQAYNELEDSEGGRVLDMDAVRELCGTYAQSKLARSLFSGSTQQAARGFIVDYMLEKKFLAPSDGESFIGLTSGGPGSGKGSIKAVDMDAWNDAEFIYDGTLQNFEAAVEIIERAKQTKRNVRIWHVYTEVSEATKRAIKRTAEKGRTLPYNVLGSAHYNSQQVIIALIEKYGSDPDVEILVVNNNSKTPKIEKDPLTFLRSERIRYRDQDETISRARKEASRNLATLVPAARRIWMAARPEAADFEGVARNLAPVWRRRGYLPSPQSAAQGENRVAEDTLFDYAARNNPAPLSDYKAALESEGITHPKAQASAAMADLGASPQAAFDFFAPETKDTLTPPPPKRKTPRRKENESTAQQGSPTVPQKRPDSHREKKPPGDAGMGELFDRVAGQRTSETRSRQGEGSEQSGGTQDLFGRQDAASDDSNDDRAGGNRGDGKRVSNVAGVGGRGSSGRGGNQSRGTSRTQRKDTAPELVERPPAGDPSRNFSIEPRQELAPRGVVSKIRANVRAVQIVHVLENEGRNATAEEKAELVKFSGWGAVPQVFDEAKAEAIERGDITTLRDTAQRFRDRAKYSYNSADYYNAEADKSDKQAADLEAWDAKWGEHYRTLKELLSEEEFRDAKRSTINAHYTSPEIITAMWDIVRKLGFKGGNVLEPGAGIGHFFGLMPEENMDRSRLYGVELDSFTSRILSALYPEAKIQNIGFQKSDIADNSIDLAISNVPFANVPVVDKALEAVGGPVENLHDYFFGKALTKLKPGGVMAFITSAFTMDKGNPEIRKWLTERADLVAAYRLPNDAFRANAGTDVVTDIIILRKKDATPFQGAGDWSLLADATTRRGETIRINEYFARNPANILGLLDNDGSMFAGREGNEKEMTVHGDPNRPPHIAIEQLLATLPENIFGSDGTRTEARTFASDVKMGNIVVQDGKFFFQGQPAPDPDLNDPKNTVRVRRFIKLRDALNRQYDLELADESSDQEIEENRQNLNTAYDIFQQSFGQIHDRKNRSLFIDDPDYFRLAGAEVEKARDKSIAATIAEIASKLRGKREYVKADIFRKRVLAPRSEPTSADSLSDAFGISLGWRGRVDVGFISHLLGESLAVVERRLVEEEIAVRDPDGGQLLTREQYLSGNVRKKLEIAREAGPAYARNVRMLETVQPENVGIEDIRFRIGSTWIPPEIYQRWLASVGLQNVQITYVSPRQAVGADVMSGVSGSDRWEVNSNESRKVGVEYKDFQTPRITLDAIVESLLNLRRITITNKDINGKTTENTAATAAARDAAKKADAAFKKWVRETPEIGEQLSAIYNREVNAFTQQTYDGQFLSFPWANKDFNIYPDKKNTIWRAIQEGFGLIAHGVGGGKTIIGSAIALEMRRLGMARKPMIVVHNSTLEGFAQEIAKMAPTARVLVGRKDELQGAKRKEFLMRIAAGDWDAVIIAHSTFEHIADDSEIELRHMRGLVDEVMSSLSEQGYDSVQAAKEDRQKPITVKNLVKQIERLEASIQKASVRLNVDEGLLNFQQLGVDALIVDEVHQFKKMPFSTKLKAKGIDSQFSKRGYALFMRARAIQERMGGKNVFTMTGTPVTNTLGEIWNMVRLVAPKLLAEYKIEQFDQFVSKFAEVETKEEMGPSGDFKNVERLSKVINIPEWATLLRIAADVKLGDGLEVKNRPGIKGGAPELVAVPLSQGVSRWVQYIRLVLDTFAGMGMQAIAENPRLTAVPLQAFMASRAAAIDIRLVQPRAKDDPGSKVNQMIERLMGIYDKTSSYNGTQVIFADSFNQVKISLFDDVVSSSNLDIELDPSKPPGTRFNLYEDIRQKLMSRGVPADEIAVITDSKWQNDKARQRLFDLVNEGKVRVVLGSTQKLGTGVNMQKRMAAAHHLDVPWTPADLEQRDGRVFRQGNIHGEMGVDIELIRYGMVDTLDAALWQKLETKQRFITMALSGKITARELEESDEVMNLAEQRAVLSGPWGRRKFAIETRMSELSASRDGHRDSANWRKREIASARNYLRILDEQAERRRPAMDAFRALGETVARDGMQVTVRGETFKTKTALTEAIKKELSESPMETIGQGMRPAPVSTIAVNGTPIFLHGQPVEEATDTEEGGRAVRREFDLHPDAQSVEDNNDISFGTVTSPATLLSRLEELTETISGIEASMGNNRQRSEQMANMAELDAWPHQKEYDALSAELIEVTRNYNENLRTKTVDPARLQTYLEEEGAPANVVREESERISRAISQSATRGVAETGGVYQPDFFGGQEGTQAGPGKAHAKAGKKASASLLKTGTSPVASPDLVAGLSGDWDALARAIDEKGRASSIFADLIERKIPSWDVVGSRIESPADVMALTAPIRSPYFESLKVAVIDGQNRVVASKILHVGSLNESIADPKAIFGELALLREKTGKKYTRLVISHNHPSGDPTPSKHDTILTSRLQDVANALGWDIVDHVITDGERYFSFRESGQIYGGTAPTDRTGSRKTPLTVPQPAPERADWEVVKRSALKQIDGPENVAELAKALRNANPDAVHVLYVNTKFQLLGIERTDKDTFQNSTKFAQLLMSGAAREGAYGFLLDLPASETQTAFLHYTRKASKFANSANLYFIDAVMPSQGDSFGGYFSYKGAGLLEDAGQYRAGIVQTPPSGATDQMHAELEHRAKAGDKDAEAEAQKMVDRIGGETYYGGVAIPDASLTYSSKIANTTRTNDVSRQQAPTGLFFFADKKSSAEQYARPTRFSEPQTVRAIKLAFNKPLSLEFKGIPQLETLRKAIKKATGYDMAENAKNDKGFMWPYDFGVQVGKSSWEKVFPWKILEGPQGASIIKAIREAGYDAIVFNEEVENAKTYRYEKHKTIAVFEPNQIKSADPFTYDDNGKLIPLSERFNSESNSILREDPASYGTQLKIDFEAAAQDDGKVPRDLFKQYLPLAMRIAGGFDNMADADETQQIARIALAKAARTFDADRGIPFPGYASVLIRHDLINRYRRETIHRERTPASLDQPVGSDSQGNPAFLGDFQPDRVTVRADVAAANHETSRMLQEAIAKLPQKMRVVIEGFLAGRTQEDIGRDAGGVTKQAVSRLQAAALRRLHGILGEMGINSPDQFIDNQATMTRKPEVPEDFDSDAVSRLMESILNDVPDYQAIAQAEEAVGATKRTGRPDLAHGADNADVRGLDQFYTDKFLPETEAQWENEARAMLERDYEGTRKTIQNTGLSGKTLSPPQTKAADMIARDLRKKMLVSGDPADRSAFNVFWYAYRSTGTAAGRAMAARHDPFKTPAERYREFLLELILTPRKEAQEAIDKETDPKKKTELINAETIALLEKLKAAGITPEDILKDRVTMRLHERNIWNEFAAAMTRKPENPRRRAFELLRGGKKSFAAIAKETGLKEEDVRAIKQSFIATMRRQHFGKFQAGARADAESLVTKKQVPDAEAEVEFARWIRRMGIVPDVEQGRPKFDIDDPAHVIRVARAIRQARGDASKWDMLYEWWIMNILSGPQTQVVNIVGNTAAAALDMTLQRGMEVIINAAIRDSKSAQIGEFKHLLAGLKPGIAKGFRLAAKAWSAEHDFFEHTTLGTPVELIREDKLGDTRSAIPNKYGGKIIRIPGRALLFMDSFFKTTLGQMEAGAQAYRIAKSEGLSGDALEKRIATLTLTRNEAIAQYLPKTKPEKEVVAYFARQMARRNTDLNADELLEDTQSEAWQLAAEQTAYDAAKADGWSDDAWVAGVAKARELTWQQDLKEKKDGGNLFEDMAAKMQKARFGNQVIGYFFPFIRTPYNIFRAGIRKSPIGSVNLAWQLSKGLAGMRKGKTHIEANPTLVRDLSEQLIAWGAFALLWGAIQGDDDDDDKPLLITGSMPWNVTRRGERDLNARATGGDYVIRVGGRNGWSINYGRIEPFAVVLGTIADMVRGIKRRGTPQESVSQFWSYLMAQASGKTFLQGFSTLTDLIEGQGNSLNTVQRMFLQALVPNIVRQPLRNIDDHVRDSRNAGIEYTLFPSGALAEPRADVYGQDVKKSGHPLVRLLVNTPLETEPTMQAADRLLLNWNRANPSEAYAPSPPMNSYTNAKGETLQMTGEQYRRYSLLAGRLAVNKLRAIATPSAVKNPRGEDIDRIRNAFSEARREARDRLFKKIAPAQK